MFYQVNKYCSVMGSINQPTIVGGHVCIDIIRDLSNINHKNTCH